MKSIKAQELLDKQGVTLYRATTDGGVNYSTVLRWINDKPEIKSFTILLGFLRGLGYSDEQIKALPLGEVFDV